MGFLRSRFGVRSCGHQAEPVRALLAPVLLGVRWNFTRRSQGDAMRNARLLALALMGSALLTSPAVLGPARADGVLRIAMTATDIPTTTGMPNNGFEGMRFLGYQIFEGLVQWDLSRTDRLAGLRP